MKTPNKINLKNLTGFLLLLFCLLWSSINLNAQSGNVLDFDGVDDYVTLGDFTLDSSAFTIEFWVKPSSIGAQMCLISNKNNLSPSEQGFAITLDGQGKINAQFGMSGSAMPHYIFSKSMLSSGLWYHVAFVRSGNNHLKLYINKNLDTDTTLYDYANNINNASGVKIGSIASTSFFMGQMDELRVWNLELTKTQIYDSLCNTLTPAFSNNLKTYYNFNKSLLRDERI